MIWKLVLLSVFIGAVYWAVRTRVRIKRSRGLDRPEAAVASPASIALGELVAIAGGIYLSLVLLVSFLKLTVPAKSMILGVPLDPLALIAVIIALLQPLGIALAAKIFR